MKAIHLLFLAFLIFNSLQEAPAHDGHEDHSGHQHHSDAGSSKQQLHNAQHDQKVEEIREGNQKELEEQTGEQKVVRFFESVQKEVGEWLSLPQNKTLERALQECYVPQNSTQLITFYESLSTLGPDITKQHLDFIPKLFRRHKHVSNILKCLSFLRQFENKFVREPRKIKYVMQFIRQLPRNSRDVFPTSRNYTLKGHKMGYFLKVLFEYYYVEVVSSMQTLATSFFRALTLRSDIFNHYDMAYCVSLDTIGELSSALENINMNNVYIKTPEVFHAVKYLKLKEECRDEENIGLVRGLREALEGLDMFNIMFNQYEPWVEIATEKFGHTQIRLIARQFASILHDRSKYLELSKKQEEGESNKKKKDEL